VESRQKEIASSKAKIPKPRYVGFVIGSMRNVRTTFGEGTYRINTFARLFVRFDGLSKEPIFCDEAMLTDTVDESDFAYVFISRRHACEVAVELTLMGHKVQVIELFVGEMLVPYVTRSTV
jgi:hypothetical protein